MLGGRGDVAQAAGERPGGDERRVKAAQFDTWSLKIKSKTEEYQGESRRRLTVTHCARPDYAPRLAPPSLIQAN